MREMVLMDRYTFLNEILLIEVNSVIYRFLAVGILLYVTYSVYKKNKKLKRVVGRAKGLMETGNRVSRASSRAGNIPHNFKR